jgi:hypothetical protein
MEMKLNASKNLDLIRQFPFVDKILAARMEPYGDPKTGVISRMDPIDDLTIRVEKADSHLMYRQAGNIGLGDSSCAFRFTDNRQDQVMRRGEYLFAIDSEGLIINRVNWPRNDDERRTTGEVYGWSVLWVGRIMFANGSRDYTDPIWDKVKYLVWVTVEAWHADTRNDDVLGGRFGEFKDRSIHITIYDAPDQGFEKLQEESSVYRLLRHALRGVCHFSGRD